MFVRAGMTLCEGDRAHEVANRNGKNATNALVKAKYKEQR